MVDPLNAWWAQQLVLCGWAFEPDPTVVDASMAATRLAELGCADRGELGWRLVAALVPGAENAAEQLAALELLALATAAAHQVAQRFMRAYAQTVDWIYSGDAKALEHYAELAKVDVATAKKMRDELWSREILSVEKVKGLDIIMQDAIEGKFIAKPLTQAEVEEMIAPWARSAM